MAPQPVRGLRRLVLLMLPPVLLISTRAVFTILSRRLGRRAGYLGGFCFYWLVWCTAVPCWVLGGRRLRARFARCRPTRGELLALAAPPAAGFALAFPAAVRTADRRILLGSAGIALVNGTLEELLWRTTYDEAFPADRLRSAVYPTIDFAVWHYAPQAVFPNRRPGGASSLVVVAGLVGWGWARVAQRQHSQLGTTASHVLFDFSGLGARVYLAPPGAQTGPQER